ncbi:MAG: AAA family ATPase [Eubacteriales bacterium]|nr:AAA family ATPase [Eubacteriales bacterium]
MNIKRAKQEIIDTVEAYLYKDEYGEYVIPQIRQRPVLLLGAPGIGKTQIMEQVARACGIGLVSYTITHHTRQSAIGLPFISHKEYGGKEYSVTEYTMSEIVASIYNKMEETGLQEGIMFIDEINCVSETLAPAMLQFLQCKTFGNHEIPRGWIIVAAGNPPEFNKSVREFDVVTMDRVKKIQVEPDFGVWKEYAYQENIHPSILSYLSLRTGFFYRMETTVDGKQFATPRGWEDLSRMISVYEKLHKEVTTDVVIQYIQHPKAAGDFAGYYELYRKYEADYQIDEILQGKSFEGMLKKVAHAPFDERMSVVNLLFSGVGQYVRRAVQREEVLEKVFDTLKLIKEVIGSSSDPLLVVEQHMELLREEWEKKKAAELLNRREDLCYRKAMELLEKYKNVIQGTGNRDGNQVFEELKEVFSGDREAYEDVFDQAGNVLENAFDFMEAAFLNSQEMVVFVSGLNTDFYSIRFLKEYECERYYRYNRELLFENVSQEIRKRIEAL